MTYPCDLFTHKLRGFLYATGVHLNCTGTICCNQKKQQNRNNVKHEQEFPHIQYALVN